MGKATTKNLYAHKSPGASELETTYARDGYLSYEEYSVEYSAEIAKALADAMNTVHKYIPSLQKWRDDHPE